MRVHFPIDGENFHGRRCVRWRRERDAKRTAVSVGYCTLARTLDAMSRLAEGPNR
jgi:hypothetical protein